MSKQAPNTIENLAAVATRTVNAYSNTGKTVAATYRKGVEIALNGSASGLDIAPEMQPALFGSETREQIAQARQKWNDLVLERLETDTSNAILALEQVAKAATNGINAAARQLKSIDSQPAQSFVDGVIALQMPVIEFSAQVADQVLAGVQQIAARVEEQAQASGIQAARPARRTARKAA